MLHLGRPGWKAQGLRVARGERGTGARGCSVDGSAGIDGAHHAKNLGDTLAEWEALSGWGYRQNSDLQ